MLLIEEKTQLIIKCFYKVHNKLGYGFLEKVYENALVIELEKEGFSCLQQAPVPVYYDNIEVGFTLQI
jgi:GxxExxY protein